MNRGTRRKPLDLDFGGNVPFHRTHQSKRSQRFAGRFPDQGGPIGRPKEGEQPVSLMVKVSPEIKRRFRREASARGFKAREVLEALMLKWLFDVGE